MSDAETVLVAGPDCPKCGKPVMVPEDLVLPAGLSLAHEPGACPTGNWYRVRLLVERFDHEPAEEETGELLTLVGHSIPAPTFVAAVDPIGMVVTEKWAKVIEFASIVEADTDIPDLQA